MIISFSKLGQNGRLGNSLFQLASTLGMAEKYGARASFPRWKYERYFNVQLPHGPISSNVVKEVYFHHYDWGLTGDSDLDGYLQSEKYFGSHRLRFKTEFLEQQRMRLPQNDKETVCIHIRRGDYVGNANYYQLGPTYFIHSLVTHFPDWPNMNIIVLSDDIEYAKVHWGCLPNVTFGGALDIEDMAMGACADHFIISNSSFSWWTAYLGEEDGSKVIHCSRLHDGPLSYHNCSDYYPERWIENKMDHYKLDLRDVTFTIPVKYDHSSRKENMDLVLCMLQKDLDTNFIVMEQGGGSFQYMSQWVQYERSKSHQFHRTKMLNDMAQLSETPFLANWDADIIVPPLQLYLATIQLRNGVDMVYPYGGAFSRMPRNPWFSAIEKALDIGIVKNFKFQGRSVDHGSVGGCVMWNKNSFIGGGMENQRFISFGPEDVERFERFTKLGYSIGRVPGSIFHLNHFVGPDSSPANPLFEANQIELARIRGMTKEQLREDIENNWEWAHKYTTKYYSEISDLSIQSAREVFRALKKIKIEPKSIIDVGCGLGAWANNHPNYWGLDYRADKSKLLFPVDHYIDHNLNLPPIDLGKKFDLCLCLEVAEHLDQSKAEPLIEFLCSLSDRILFSAAIPYQGGNGHFNEQFQSWWANLFSKHGFGPSKKQPNIRGNDKINMWYRQNTILYEKGGQGASVLDFVLPTYYIEIVKGLKS